MGPMKEETRDKISIASNGKPRGSMKEETKARISIAKKS
jgi:hypothetical protein